MNSKKELWLLLASFVLPIALGTAFFYLSPTSFTQSTVNYGQFVNPIISTNEKDIVFSDETPGTLNNIWTLSYATDNCDDTCIDVLKSIQTVRILMNDDMRRLQLILLTSNSAQKVKNILIAEPSQSLSKKLSKFQQGSIFLIDPFGNIMMHYSSSELDIKKVVKDLGRLFKYSRVG